MSDTSSTRRDFLSGKAALQRLRDGIELPDVGRAPVAGNTVRLTARAMACEFAVIMNAGVSEHVQHASDALDVVAQLEQQMSVYRDDSELSQVNRNAHQRPMPVETRLFQLLIEAKGLREITSGSFDITSGPLVTLWRNCREQGRVPTQAEIDHCLETVGLDHVQLDRKSEMVAFDREGIELNLGGIGKGHALDRASEVLVAREMESWLLHGGHSSLLAKGEHHGLGGWPVGLGNPLFTSERLATILLRDQAMSTSGSNVQHFRHQGRRYGHILDPRTGWPVHDMASVAVLAATASVADALSTAFFVMGVEKTTAVCDNLDGVGAILIPFPETGRRVSPVIVGIPDDVLFWNDDQVAL